MLIVNLPIEDLEERYSKQWNEGFEEYISDYNVQNVKTIYPGTLRSNIKDGAFLDITGTVYFKSKQIASIAKKVDEGEIPRNEKVVFLIQDGWFPVEQLAYIKDMLGCRYWKFVGIFHSGTYDEWDMTARKHLYTWGKDIETGWFKIYDAIVVASLFHRGLLISERNVFSEKIHVIPWNVTVPDLDTKNKENIIVFPHRLDVEKQPDLFLEIADELRRPNWQWIRTKDECKTKTEYYQLLAKSKIAVSCSLQETFGIAMMEAVKLGCIPIVPDSLCYRELYKAQYRYQDISSLKAILKFWMDMPLSSTKDMLGLVTKPALYHQLEAFYSTLFSLIKTV